MVKGKENTKASETDAEFLDLKDESRKKIINITLWSVLIIWIIICFIDFTLVKTENKPVFCTFSKTTEYNDGNVNSCYGLGYKVYNYEREDFTGLEFAPIWGKDKSEK